MSATINVMLQNKYQLVYNPEFNLGGSGWYYHSESSRSDVAFDPPRLYNGIVLIRGGGTVYEGTANASLLFYQYIKVPNVTIENAILTVNYSLQIDRPLISNSTAIVIVSLYDVDEENWTFVSLLPETQVFRSLSFDVTANLTPGHTYVIIVLAYAEATAIEVSLPIIGRIIIPSSIYVELSLDSVFLNATSSEYSFSGRILNINITVPRKYYARLLTVEERIEGNVSGTLILADVYGKYNVSIALVNGIVAIMDNGWTILEPVSVAGYSSGHIYASISSQSTVNATLHCIAEICTGASSGACVYIPLTLILTSSSKQSSPTAPYQVRINSSREVYVDIINWHDILSLVEKGE